MCLKAINYIEILLLHDNVNYIGSFEFDEVSECIIHYSKILVIRLHAYHELTTLWRIYEQNKPVLALLIHDIPRRLHCWILFNNDKTGYYILLSDFQRKQNEAWVKSRINNALRLYLRAVEYSIYNTSKRLQCLKSIFISFPFKILSTPHTKHWFYMYIFNAKQGWTFVHIYNKPIKLEALIDKIKIESRQIYFKRAKFVKQA